MGNINYFAQQNSDNYFAQRTIKRVTHLMLDIKLCMVKSSMD
jgi:hypothetical protein